MTKFIVRLSKSDIAWLSENRPIQFPVYDKNGKRTYMIELNVTEDDVLYGVKTVEE